MKLIIDFEAVTRQYRIKEHDINDIPYCFSLLLLNEQKREPKYFFIDIVKNNTNAIFAIIKKYIINYLKGETKQTFIDFNDITFYCFGKLLEEKILSKIIEEDKLHIIDINKNYRVGLSDLAGALIKRDQKYLNLEKEIDYKIQKHYQEKEMHNYDRWNLKSSGAKASLLGYFIYLEDTKKTRNKHYIKDLKTKSVNQYIELYSLQDVKDIRYIINNEATIEKLAQKIAKFNEIKNETKKIKRSYTIVLEHATLVKLNIKLLAGLTKEITRLDQKLVFESLKIEKLLKFNDE